MKSEIEYLDGRINSLINKIDKEIKILDTRIENLEEKVDSIDGNKLPPKENNTQDEVKDPKSTCDKYCFIKIIDINDAIGYLGELLDDENLTYLKAVSIVDAVYDYLVKERDTKPFYENENAYEEIIKTAYNSDNKNAVLDLDYIVDIFGADNFAKCTSKTEIYDQIKHIVGYGNEHYSDRADFFTCFCGGSAIFVHAND